MRIIGLCGRSGSGKSLLCSIASQNGIKTIDCDVVYKDLVSFRSECLLEIAGYFGEAVIKDNALNRRYLAPIVFSDPEKLSALNTIAHKHITAEIDKILSSLDKESIVILDAPTLFESGIDKKCELIIGVVASDEMCIQRIMKRDNISESDARQRLANQYSAEFIVGNCDHIVFNDSAPELFEASVNELVRSLKEGSL